MSSDADAYRFPYTSTPGSSTAGPEVSPKEGVGELWAFFWLALLNTAIIVVAGLATWYVVH
ncbi:MAG: hypothetical protein L3K06_03835 [Thermoplasmata archaeon]|nr:hypothetical protein [Thermoplasmata archaeon]MCI4354476.1 hypothetical protein [Thermoplasmata archaeon]